ncbi:MAG TPA: hypothetical protein VJN67_06165 [Stellaceae bacterium]|nr:hypothetical protein [Stellaceae bacterium]
MRYSPPVSARNIAAVLAASLVLSLAYWLISLLIFPHQSLDVAVLYRLGDVEDYPRIKELAELNFFPTYDGLNHADGMSLNPYGGNFIHALCFRLFGMYGFVVADIVAYAIFAVAMYRIFVQIAPKPRLAIAFILLAASLWLQPYLVYLNFYYPRIPRPLIAELWFLLFIAEFLKFDFSTRKFLTSAKGSIYLGVLAALNLLSDPYSFLVIGLLLGATFLHDLALAHAGTRRVAISRYAALAVTCALLSVPLLIQVVYASPGLKDRFGAFPITDRLLLIRWFLFSRPDVAVAVVAAIVCFASIIPRATQGYRSKLMAANYALIAAIVAPFLVFAVMPSELQPYHHHLVITGMRNLLLTIMAYAFLTIVIEHLNVGPHSVLSKAFPAAIGAIVLIYYTSLANIVAFVTDLRSDLAAVSDPKTYRNDFAAAVSTVEQYRLQFPKQRSLKLLTNDYLIMTWWLMKGYGEIQMPDVSQASLPNAIVEQKAIDTGKILGWSSDEWLETFTHTYPQYSTNPFLNLFLAHDRYQAWMAHTAAPLEDYPADFVARIQSDDDPWSLVVPSSEVKRLRQRYEDRSAAAVERPDIIVLTCYKRWPCGSRPAHLNLPLTHMGNIDLFIPGSSITSTQ